MPTLTADFLRQSIGRTYVALGTSAADAAIVAEHLVDAELTGIKSHGIIRVPQYVQAVCEGRVRADAKATIVRETTATAAIDGGTGFGQVMALQSADKAIQLAKSTGAGVVTLVNCGHTGRLGHYTEHAARQGFVAIMMVNAGGHGQWVAPFGGLAGRLSTNPMSIAVPNSGDFPLVLDIATSVAPEGRIRALKAEGRPTPDGWLIDHTGRPTTNPADLYGPPRGAILPFGGHKGFGLALLIDALAGGLSGAGCCTRADAPSEGCTDGVLFMAIQPDAFVPSETFAGQVQQLIAHVKSSPPMPGVSQVLVPGEQEARLRQRGEREGIWIDDELWELVQASLVSA